MNIINLSGTIGRDLELKTAPSGATYVNFSLAVDGEYDKIANEQKTDWFNCTAFGKNAEFICNWAKKGQFIGITGSIHPTMKEDKTYWNVKVIDIDRKLIFTTARKEDKKEQSSKPVEKTHQEVLDKSVVIDLEDLPF